MSLILRKSLFCVVLILIMKLCEFSSQIYNSSNKVRRSMVDSYGSLPFAPFGAIPPFNSFPTPAFPSPSFPPSFSIPLGPAIPLPPPPVLPSPFPPMFPLPFYPNPSQAFPCPCNPPAPPLLPATPAGPPPAPIILPAHTAATLSVASLLHALIAKKFYPPVVPFPVPKPVPFPVTVKVPVPVPVPVEKPNQITILRPADQSEESFVHGDHNHEISDEWHSSPPNQWHTSPDSNEYSPGNT